MRKIKTQRDLFSALTGGFLVLLLTVFLFSWDASGYEGISAVKIRMFTILCGGYAAVTVLLSAELLLVGESRWVSPLQLWHRASWPQRLTVLYLVFTWISAVHSPYFPDTVLGVSRYEGALSITIYGVCFLLVSVYGRGSERLLTVLGVAAAVFGGLCLLQLGGGNPLGLYPEGHTYAGAYVDYNGAFLGTIGNVDLVAAFLTLVIPLLWIGLLRLRGKKKYLLVLPLLLSLTVLVKMSVLAGLVGVFAGGVLCLPVVLEMDGRRKRLVAGIIAAGALAGLISLYAVDMGSGLWHELHEILHGNVSDTFGSGRIHIWRQVLQKIPGELLWGSGPDTMLRGGLEAFTRYHEASGTMIVSEIDVAHNEYLNILYHQGIPALAAYMGLLLSLAKLWVEKSRENGAVAMLGGAALCYCIQAFFGFSSCSTAPFFWVTLALLEKHGRKGEGTQ